MSCPSCKGTGQVVLLYSSVACTDCAELPAAPMLKCAGFKVGDRLRITRETAAGYGLVGTVVAFAQGERVFVSWDGWNGGETELYHIDNLADHTERVKDTI